MERTEPASPRKLADAKKRGEVPSSAWLTAAFVTFALLLGNAVYGEDTSRLVRKTFKLGLANFSMKDPASLSKHFVGSLGAVVSATVPWLLLIALSVMLSRWIQSGFVWSPEALTPTLNRLNPGRGWARLASRHIVISYLRDILGIFLVIAVSYLTLVDSLGGVAHWSEARPGYVLGQSFTWFFAFLGRIGIVLLVIGALDLLYQRWKYFDDLRMTRRELLDELRETEGNPRARETRRKSAISPRRDAR